MRKEERHGPGSRSAEGYHSTASGCKANIGPGMAVLS